MRRGAAHGVGRGWLSTRASPDGVGTCGKGTRLEDGTCVADDTDTGGDTDTGETGDTGVACTVAADGNIQDAVDDAMDGDTLVVCPGTYRGITVDRRDSLTIVAIVKAPVFPWRRFPGVDTVLDPEMRSTGEVMGVGTSFGEAYAKALVAAGLSLPSTGGVFMSFRDADKHEAPPIRPRAGDATTRRPCASPASATACRR